VHTQVLSKIALGVALVVAVLAVKGHLPIDVKPHVSLEVGLVCGSVRAERASEWLVLLSNIPMPPCD